MTPMEIAQLLGNFGEFFGAIAVVATLGYLAMQIRQNTRSLVESQKLSIAQAYENRSNAIGHQLLQLRESPHIEVLSLQMKPEEFESAEDQLRYGVNLRWWMNMSDNVHFQHQQGYIDPEYYDWFCNTIRRTGAQWRAFGIKEPRESFRIEVDRILEKGKR